MKPEDFTNEQLTSVINEWRVLKDLLNDKSLRPIRLPNDLTSGEFNWLVQFLKEQRVKLINISGQIPKPIQIPAPLSVVNFSNDITGESELTTDTTMEGGLNENK